MMYLSDYMWTHILHIIIINHHMKCAATLHKPLGVSTTFCNEFHYINLWYPPTLDNWPPFRGQFVNGQKQNLTSLVALMLVSNVFKAKST